MYVYFFQCKDVAVISNKIKKEQFKRKSSKNHSKCQTSNAFKLVDEITKKRKSRTHKKFPHCFLLKNTKTKLGHTVSPNKRIESRPCKYSFYHFQLDKKFENVALRINYLSELFISIHFIRIHCFFMSLT